MNPSSGYENIVVHPHNVTNIIIEKNIPGDSLANAPLRLVTAPNNVLSSFRNGPVKAGLTVSAKPYPKTSDITKPRNPTPIARDQAAPKPVPVKKQRPSTAQHARPASPGIRGKVAEAPYKGAIKSYIVPKEKGRTGASPRQATAVASSTLRPAVNSMSLRGISPGKPRWKA